MDPTLSEDSSHLPIEEIEKDLQNLYADNADLEKSIEDKKKQLHNRRDVTAALVMERNWYVQVLDRLEQACLHDDRLSEIQKIIKNGVQSD